MKVEIIVDGVSLTYVGDYDLHHNQDWNERVRDLLDSVHEHVGDTASE